MPDYRKFHGNHRLFRYFAGSRNFRLEKRYLPSGLLMNEYTVTLPELAGESFLFFTDLHIRFGTTGNLFAPHGPGSWHGTGWIRCALNEAVEMMRPDYLLFGGDLVTYAVCYPAAMEMMASLSAPCGCFAVLGNWDKRRRWWLPFREIERLYERAGWRLLVNESVRSGGVEICGVDDYKMGIPRVCGNSTAAAYRILLSHNPDTVAELPPDELSRFDLALCGHTHGGQIRIPFFGALRASSRYWKRFEYGCRSHRMCDTAMIVSSGIGTTWLHVRMNCPPEIVLVRFQR